MADGGVAPATQAQSQAAAAAQLSRDESSLGRDLPRFQKDANKIARIATCWSVGQTLLGLVFIAGAIGLSRAKTPSQITSARTVMGVGLGLSLAWGVGAGCWHRSERKKTGIDLEKATVGAEAAAVAADLRKVDAGAEGQLQAAAKAEHEANL
jgi:hypothetical protein